MLGHVGEDQLLADRREPGQARFAEVALDVVLGGVAEAPVRLHRSVGGGSVSDDATRFGREHGMTVIDGGCPLMFGPTSDGGHKVMCAVLKLTGRVPRTV